MNFARHILRHVATPLTRQRVVILPSLTAPLRVSQTPIPRIIIPRLTQQQVRHESTTIGTLGGTGGDQTDGTPVEPKSSYDLTFTCRPCGHRSTHKVSKQGYHYGSVLITCPGCHNRHVISDHLKIFSETSRSFEEILAQSGTGERVKKYTAAQRSYEEQLGAEDTLRERGIWSDGGNHVEVLPEEAKEVEEKWQMGLEVTEDTRLRAESPGEAMEGAGKEGVEEKEDVGKKGDVEK